MTIVSRFAALLFCSLAVSAADNSWKKVQDLANGAEIRVFIKGAAQPVVAKFDEANEDRVTVLVKNEQRAIAKEDIDRLEARPVAPARRKLRSESRVTEVPPDTTPHPSPAIPAPTTSYSSSVSMSSKPDFETVYRRPPGAPK